MPNLAKTTDTALLAAISRMQPWPEVCGSDRWALREAGRQILIYGGADLDLSSESGPFRVNIVNSQTGEVKSGQPVNAGVKVKLPEAKVVWLTRQ